MNISPLNETGTPVEWWFIYKVPHGAKENVSGIGPATGYEYAYYDEPLAEVQASTNKLNGGQGALNLTLKSIFNSTDTSVGWVLYNDEKPLQCAGTKPGKDNGELGHSKGAIFFDTATQTALWLLHSWPKYVCPGSMAMGAPNYGQTYLCLSLSLQDAQTLAEQMITHQQPQVFNSKLPHDLPADSNIAKLCGPIDPSDPGEAKVLDLSTRNGMNFKVIAKNRGWGRDFWNDLVAPTLHEDINVETWIRGKNVIPPNFDSDQVYSTDDIKYISLQAIGLPWAWPEVQDHAKWAISHKDNWICVGDINRMISQEQRGGCTIAFQDPALWTLLSKTDVILMPRVGSTVAEAVADIQQTHAHPTGMYQGNRLPAHPHAPAAPAAQPTDSYYHDHGHASGQKRLTKVGSPSQYGSIVGTVDKSQEKIVKTTGGVHLKFHVDMYDSVSYEVDMNIQSKDGSDIMVYIADEGLPQATTNPPFGPEHFGVFPNATLSYKDIGLKDSDFVSADEARLGSQLEQALNASEFVAVYGFVYDDGGDKGKGIHENHYNPGKKNQDGAVAVYLMNDSGNPTRRWFYFKFANETIA